MEKPTVLVCALADAPRAVPGSVFDECCSVCGRAVMIAPTGQRVLRSMPLTQIVCSYCYGRTPATSADSVEGAGSIDELLKEARSARPNLRRSRN